MLILGRKELKRKINKMSVNKDYATKEKIFKDDLYPDISKGVVILGMIGSFFVLGIIIFLFLAW